MNLHEKLTYIAEHYGLDTQLIKLGEEGAEFAAASLKNIGFVLRMMNGETSPELIKKRQEANAEEIKELADVLLVSRQIEHLILSEPAFEKQLTQLMNEKADRQLSRIKEETK